MSMIGGGFMNDMNKVIQQNRDLLKKGSLKERLGNVRYGKDSGKDWKFKSADKNLLDKLKNRTAEERKRSFFKGTLLLVTLTGLIGIGSWYLFNVRVDPPKSYYLFDTEQDPIKLYTTKTYKLEKEMELRVEYISMGEKISETKYKRGLKHQNSESYYPSGEQFRSATYFYDTLVVAAHYFKNGDVIPDFPDITDDGVHHMAFRTPNNKRIISFDYWDGKIVPTTYQEYDVEAAGVVK